MLISKKPIGIPNFLNSKDFKNMEYELIVGLEIHVQSKVKSKMFCSCSSDYFGDEPNTHTCPVCIGLPGALPVPNQKALDLCAKLGLALNCEINKETKFDRKNYFYPDLPKGYQISQYDVPVAEKGYIEFEVDGKMHRVGIHRVHQEEDTGKSVHKGANTLLDYNKSGVALIEIVTEPDMHNIDDVLGFARMLKLIIQYNGISDADMEKGQMRFEPNISLRPKGEKDLPNWRVEVKNIGSISVLENVIKKEQKRLKQILDEGETPKRETRGLVDMEGNTVSQRSKETEADYRYFPEPDIPPIIFTGDKLNDLKEQIALTPLQRMNNYKEIGLDDEAIDILVNAPEAAKLYDRAISTTKDSKLKKGVANWVIGEYMRLQKEKEYKDVDVNPKHLLQLEKLVQDDTITGNTAKEVLEKVFKTNKSPSDIVKQEGLEVVSDTNVLEETVENVIVDNPKAVEDYKNNPNAIMFLVGQVMGKMQGKADAKKVKAMLEKKLS
jgi:aspartyl-tRNA(Asn)/glutamyl-tRNA(Gln) amidotransferase subunit B